MVGSQGSPQVGVQDTGQRHENWTVSHLPLKSSFEKFKVLFKKPQVHIPKNSVQRANEQVFQQSQDKKLSLSCGK